MLYKSVVDLPLHSGKCPPWLFEKMVRLSRAILLVVIQEFGKKELLRRLADPFWFQALGCLLGFDWHSSGLTTTVGGAIKKALEPLSREVQIFVCGGKGKFALHTPQEIAKWGEVAGLSQEVTHLQTLSRLVARVDNNALQDGFNLYFHLFIFSSEGEWVVIQQGMDEETQYARRYQWFSNNVKDFFSDPHQGIVSPIEKKEVLNLVAKESKPTREHLINILKEPLEKVLREVTPLFHHSYPQRHFLLTKDLSLDSLKKVWEKTYDNPPEDFKDLILRSGIGAKALRALTLTTELIYDVQASRRDPVHFAYAHGGKDGYPYKLDPRIYEATIQELESLLQRSKISPGEKDNSLKRLLKIFSF